MQTYLYVDFPVKNNNKINGWNINGSELNIFVQIAHLNKEIIYIKL